MKVEILPVKQEDLPAVSRFLQQEWSGRGEDETRERLRTQKWMPGNDGFGFRLMADGNVVGFLGATYSARDIDGVSERFCAIAPWFVKEEYRSHSLQMLFRLLADRHTTYVNLTPTREMFKLFSALGFIKLDQVKLIIPPLLNAVSLRPLRCRLIADLNEMRDVLEDADLKIFEDHLDTRCCHLAIRQGKDVCYIAASRRTLRRLPFAEILHVSKPELIRSQFERIVWFFCFRLRTIAVACDERLLQETNVRSIRYELSAPPLFKSPHVDRRKINNMWSELAL